MKLIYTEKRNLLTDYIIRLSESIKKNPGNASKWKKDIIMLTEIDNINIKLFIENDYFRERVTRQDFEILELKSMIIELRKELLNYNKMMEEIE